MMRTYSMSKRPFIAILIMLLFRPALHAQNINTFAGSGASGYSGDGAQATSAEIGYPWGFAKDAAGNIYVSDAGNGVVRKIAPSGIITTIAGTGTSGYNGDEIPATTAQLNWPHGIALDAAGNIYICEYNGHRVRKIDAAGIIHAFAGIGTTGYAGDSGLATSATITSPSAIAFDKDGNAYISSEGTSRIRKVNTSGIISTFAGKYPVNTGDGGSADSVAFGRLDGIAFDSKGNLYVAEWDAHRIRKIDTGKIVTTFAGIGVQGFSGDGGLATSAMLNQPRNFAIDSFDNIFIVDHNNNRIRRVDPLGKIQTIAGIGTMGFSGDGGPAILAELNHPASLLIDNGQLLITDLNNHRIRKMEMPLNISNRHQSEKNIRLFPSPNSGNFSIVADPTTSETSVTINVIDVTGKIVYKQLVPISAGKVNVQIRLPEAVPEGQYILKIITEKGASAIMFEKK